MKKAVPKKVNDVIRSAQSAQPAPHGARVLVVSRGDDAFTSLSGLEGWHFPALPDGSWIGDKRWMEQNPVLVTAYVVLALQEAQADLKEHPPK